METETHILKDTNIKRISTKFLCLLVFLFVFFSVYGAAEAATLYFSPSSGSYTVGSTLSLNIYASSPDQAMNAASGVISFPSANLEIVSLSKNGSIFSLWVQEPSFSNSAGTINFEGIVLNPGFTGQSGKIITANFRVKGGGTALLNFSSGSVLANDGKGTNILTNLGNASFALGGAAPPVPEATTPTGSAGIASAPQITSPTHSDSNKWYSNKNPQFLWLLPSDVTAVRLLVGKIPNAIPTVTYAPPIVSKEIENLDDGIWYFHVRFKNNAGWGDVAHFRFQIDTEPPQQFSVKFVGEKETENPRPTALFDTTDSLSGMDYYKVKIGEGDFFSLSSETVKSNPHTLPLQAPGKRTILVQAFDKAGNYTTATEEFVIKPLQSPSITDYARELNEEGPLIIKGLTYPKATVRITVQTGDNGKTNYQEILSDEKGSFTLIWEKKLASGIYKFRAEVTDEKGAKSNPTDNFVFSIKPGELSRLSYFLFNYLFVGVALVAVFLALLFSVWYLWNRFRHFRKKLKKEVIEAESTLHKAFDVLRENVQEELRLLEKTRTRRELTQEEERLIKQLKKTLDNTEKLLRKEIEDIEKIA